ncbi:tripartite tricarboxylate transporter substrate binding protein [Polaromonas hydrogenivorans]|uniref:Tripartite tricarboxylate transporter substrate binding protein n=1 Tax=Polaromonas hydrogenivorans TaxID=335476 RepID=A0AAU7LXP9_9BURK
MKLNRLLTALLGMLVLSTSVLAQTWPEKPVRLLVSFPPGAPGDIVARMIQPELQKELGQPVVVENRPGAGGNIGAAEVARASDQHTFLIGPDTMVTINPHLYKKMGFNPLEDLKPVSHLISFNQMLVCHPGAQIKTLADLMAKSKTQPMNYASGGPGVPGHMAMEMLLAATGMKMDHIPYRGPAPAMQDVMAGQVPCGFLAAPGVGPQVRGGKLVALGVSGARRSPGSPDVATLAQLGVKDFDASFFEILAAPKSTPPAVIDRLSKAVTKVLQQPEVRAKLLAVDMEPLGNTPVESMQRLRMDHQKWGKVAADIALQLD